MFPIQNGVATRYAPFVTWGLIAANCVVFLIQISLTPDELAWFLWRFALIPAHYFGTSLDVPPAQDLADYLPFFTSMFLHGGWLHLILNMWSLWIFGPPVEDRLGPGRYLALYLVAGVIASLTHALFNADSTIPSLGASGAIAGVMGCYVRLFPLSRLVVVVPILFIPLFFEVPALVFIGFWFLMQVLQGMVDVLGAADTGPIAWWAHIGGFVAGLILGRLLQRPRRSYRPYYSDEGVLGFTPGGRR